MSDNYSIEVICLINDSRDYIRPLIRAGVLQIVQIWISQGHFRQNLSAMT